ncbi:hypothetical protein ACSLO9_33860, partial [Escherichia coli]
SASYRLAWNRRRRCQLPPACYCTDWHRAQQPLNGDRKSYQMNPMNRREAIRESLLDEAQGADCLMVK